MMRCSNDDSRKEVLELAMRAGAAFRQLRDFPQGEVRIRERKVMDRLFQIFMENVALPVQVDRDAGGAEKLQIPVETTRVQLQLSSQRFSRLWARAKELHEPIQPGSAICGDRLLLGVGAGAALRGHGVLCAAVDGMAPEKTDKPRARPAKGQTVMVGMRWREIKMLSQ